ncbi:MAG TPA: hypothetical protein VMB80_17280 [Candidatus Acidoferrum sp.]|nr:hypothetical protein [Candidatus Acidoferrum sp.]
MNRPNRLLVPVVLAAWLAVSLPVSADSTAPPLVLMNPACAGGSNATLNLMAWPGDYVIQTATNFPGAWRTETNISVGRSGQAAVAFPLRGRPRLFIRAAGQSPSDGLGCMAQFLTLGSSFAPEVHCDAGAPAKFLWIWSDATTTTNYPVASKNFGTAGARWQGLLIQPSNVVTSINLGFDGSDGGETTPLDNYPSQNVGAVRFAQPIPSLQYWASSYNPITNTLDFSGFTNLAAIECYHCAPLQHVVVSNLPSLKRVCFEDCDLAELDLSGNPNFEDLRGAMNTFTNIMVDRGTGPRIWHWCVRDNPQLSQRFQDIMTNFYSLQELYIWNDNQGGVLTTGSTNLTDVDIYDNHYTLADFTGQSRMWRCEVFDNQLTNLIITGCTGLQYLDAHSNQLTTSALDNVLAFLDASAPDVVSVDLSQNPQLPSDVGYGHCASLMAKGVDVSVDWPAPYNVSNAITFITISRNPHMEIQTGAGPATNILWHWGDGAVTSGALVASHNFGSTGTRTNYIQVLPAGSVTYFGAQSGRTGQGIQSVYGAAKFPNLSELYLDQESLQDLSLAGCSHLLQLRLAGNAVSTAVCDQWFIDLNNAVAGPVTGADFYYPASRRTSASDAAWTSLVNKGYVMHPN